MQYCLQIDYLLLLYNPTNTEYNRYGVSQPQATLLFLLLFSNVRTAN